MKKKAVNSVIQCDFMDLLLTGYYCIHHVFEGTGRRKLCEKYGFMVALRPAEHNKLHEDIACEESLAYKQQCQQWYEENIGNRSGFILEFGKNYL